MQSKKALDVLGQELKDGDFVASASKSADSMIFGVLKSVDKQTRIKIYKSGGIWLADAKPHRMYTLGRTLKLSDQMLLEMDESLFEIMVKVREGAKLPTNKELIQQQKALRAYLEGIL